MCVRKFLKKHFYGGFTLWPPQEGVTHKQIYTVLPSEGPE